MSNFAQVKKVSLICCGQGFNKEYQAHYNRYRVLVEIGKDFRGMELEGLYPLEQLFSNLELEKLPYWVNRSKVMAMTCWGTSQRFEAIINLARFLGLDDKNWSEFTKQAEEKIKEI